MRASRVGVHRHSDKRSGLDIADDKVFGVFAGAARHGDRKLMDRMARGALLHYDREADLSNAALKSLVRARALSGRR